MRSLRYAALLAVGYTLLAGVYIVVSSAIAARLSADVEDLRRIETVKGVLYVLVTATGIFAGAWAMLARLDRSEAELRARERALLANERRVFAGVLAASIVHDANNVLMGLMAGVENIRETRGRDEAHLRSVGDSVNRLVSLNRRLMGTIRHSRPGGHERVDVGNEVRDLVAAMRQLGPIGRCRLDVVGGAGVVMTGNRAMLQPIVSNLVLNAAEAAGENGRIEVRLESAGPEILLEVHDNGPGIPVERRDGLFDALETTKPDGNGLGLFSVQACARALNGSVAVDESPLGGACFRVVWPSNPDAAASS